VLGAAVGAGAVMLAPILIYGAGSVLRKCSAGTDRTISTNSSLTSGGACSLGVRCARLRLPSSGTIPETLTTYVPMPGLPLKFECTISS
jgi:hypothetical protein